MCGDHSCFFWGGAADGGLAGDTAEVMILSSNYTEHRANRAILIEVEEGGKAISP